MKMKTKNAEAKATASEICHMTEAQILLCLDNSNITQDELRRIGLRALQKYFGEHSRDEDKYLTFLFDVLINRPTINEPFIRENHVDNIILDVPHATAERICY